MKIYEYQAKEIFRKYNIPVPVGYIIADPEEAELIARILGTPVIIKAQILAGGRGKGGGVKEAVNDFSARVIAFQLLGKRLVTPQTPAEGMLVSKLLIEKKLYIKKEFYLGITVDRERACPVVMLSEAGGTAIEEIAKNHPEKICKEYIDPRVGLQELQKENLALSSKLPSHIQSALMNIISNLYRIFEERECLLVEINPLALTGANWFSALDAKIVFDDNALFRHPENRIFSDPLADAGTNYIELEGNIGCMANGAGLAMATMDTIKFFGGEPANFLDIGGGASPEKIKTAFQILTSDPSVKVIFINIFGGIFRCDFLAEGLLRVWQEKQFNLPLVLRLEGTNAAQGLKMLKKGGVKFFKVSGLSQGAKKAIELTNRGGRQ